MSSSSLTRLYFESVRNSQPLLPVFIGCSIAVHLALVFLPLDRLLPARQTIAFADGDAGVQVELIAGEMPAFDLPQSSAPAATVSQVIPEMTPPLEVPLMPPDEIVFAEAVREPLNNRPRKSNVVAAHASSSTKENESGGARASRAGSAAVQPATQIVTTQPPYPAGARESGVQGSVRLRVRVGVNGYARDVEIARSSGRSDFDGTSMSTVKREWRFRAARTSSGAPVESTVLVTIRFQLNS